MFYNLNVNIVMFLHETKEKNRYTRQSKLGVSHTYYRYKTILHFICDNCGTEFSREKGSMNHMRISNNFFHVCKNCDAKRFAQMKGVERKKVWSLTASSNLPIGKI